MQTFEIHAAQSEFLPTTSRRSTLKRFCREEEGQSLVEYGLLISLIALVAVVAIRIFGNGVNNGLYGNANTSMANLPTS